MAWFVYLLRCADDSLYTGITTDVRRRVKEHNAGQGGAYTRAKGPAKLFFKEPHPTRSAALIREAQIKRLTRAQKLELV